MENRGRPKLDVKPPPKKYTQRFKDWEGKWVVWKWDKTKFANGPISVEVEYPKEKLNKVLDQDLPKTQRKYLNPKNNKYVGYQRAKQLGLI